MNLEVKITIYLKSGNVIDHITPMTEEFTDKSIQEIVEGFQHFFQHGGVNSQLYFERFGINFPDVASIEAVTYQVLE